MPHISAKIARFFQIPHERPKRNRWLLRWVVVLSLCLALAGLVAWPHFDGQRLRQIASSAKLAAEQGNTRVAFRAYEQLFEHILDADITGSANGMHPAVRADIPHFMFAISA
jgi:hypothetical protein